MPSTDDFERVAKEIAEADIMATTVGVNVLSKIAGPISAGLKERFDTGGTPLSTLTNYMVQVFI